MKPFVKLLQNPMLKIFVSPASSILFGFLIGITNTAKINYYSLLLLYIIVLAGQLIHHYFFIKYSTKNTSATPPFILVFCEVVMLLAMAAFYLNHHILISFLVFIYYAYIHLEYFPINLSHTHYHYILDAFFNGFILSAVAYFAQANTITTVFLVHLTPLILMQIGLQWEYVKLRSHLMNDSVPTIILSYPFLTLSMCVIAIVLGFFLSLPSTTFYIVQIIASLISLATIVPLFVQTHQQKQSQNKINYMSAIFLVFSLSYALSYMF